MRNIEHPNGISNSFVFYVYAFIRDWHIVTGKGYHFGAECLMRFSKCSIFQNDVLI